MNLQFTILLLGFAMLVVILLYSTLYYNFNRKKIASKTDKTILALRDNEMKSLLNGSGINNIPHITINSTNSEVTTINRCGNGPTFVGDVTDNINKDTCVRMCMTSSAKLIKITKNEKFIYDGTELHPGYYCSLAPRPMCNTNTTIAIITANNVSCKPKYPRLVGGDIGSSIVACNNSNIYNPNNILWDNKYNRRFDPFLTYLTDENELLPNGDYRFTCKYNGVGSNGNKYIAHPLDRLHPIENFCASLIHKAHRDVQTLFPSENTFTCECGDENETRVKNLNPLDKSSPCAHTSLQVKTTIKEKSILEIPYKCFNIFSPIEDITKYPPCPDQQYTKNNSKLASTFIHYTDKPKQLIEHPSYEHFSNDGAEIKVGAPLS